MTRTTKFALVTASGITLAACTGMSGESVGSDTVIATTILMDRSGNPAGTARLYAVGDTAEIMVMAQGLQPGQHGFHLHTTGRCVLPDFTSAGGHLNPSNEGHGLADTSDGSHLGDLPNLTISANGTGTMRTPVRGTLDYVMENVFDADDTAVVIHADPDDGRTNPSGNAGQRELCGVLERVG